MLIPRKKILFVTDKFPWPLDDGGQIRTFQILKCLAGRYAIKLLAISPPPSVPQERIRELGVEVCTFARHQYAWTIPFRITQSLFTARPYPLPKNFSHPILAAIKCELQDGNVAALHLNHLDAAQYIDWMDHKLAKVRVVFDTHNILSSLYARLFAYECNPVRKAYCWLQLQKVRKYERKTMNKVNCVVVCSRIEQHTLTGCGITNTIVVPNGVDPQYFFPADRLIATNQTYQLVFTGALDYGPNADGIRWFIRSVVPLLDRILPDYKLTIVGKNPPKDLLTQHLPGKLHFTGRVTDVRPYTRMADVFVVPLKVAGGTRLKILEALAMGVPVVSTAVGAEGLDLEDGIHVRLVDEPSSMAEAIAKFCSNREYARDMAQCGRKKVMQSYDWTVATEPLSLYYGKVLPIKADGNC